MELQASICRKTSEAGLPRTDLLGYSHTPVRGTFGNSTKWYLDEFFPQPDPRWAWVCLRQHDLVHKLRYHLDGTWSNEVFDLSADPQERRNLFDSDDPLHQENVQRLARYKERLISLFQKPNVSKKRAAERRQRLRALGYIE